MRSKKFFDLEDISFSDSVLEKALEVKASRGGVEGKAAEVALGILRGERCRTCGSRLREMRAGGSVLKLCPSCGGSRNGAL